MTNFNLYYHPEILITYDCGNTLGFRSHTLGSGKLGLTCSSLEFTILLGEILLAGVPGGFSRGPPVFAHLLIGPSHMS